MYNAVIISVFNTFEVGFVECKNLVAIPLTMRGGTTEYVIRQLKNQDRNGFKRLLAVKFVKIKGSFILPFREFKILRKNYQIIEESDWYLNDIYDTARLGQIDRMADPSIILRGDDDNVKYRLRYYVGLRRSGYTESEALDIIYS